MARNKRVEKARKGGLIVGRITINRRGYGFVEAEEGDIYVASRDTAGAMHRDIVGVRVSTTRSHRGRSGVVVKVIERANDTVVGRYERHGKVGIVVPTDPRIRTEVFVSSRDPVDARDGDVVVARLTAYPSRRNAAQGIIEEVLGREGEPGLEIEVIIREYGLRTAFPDDALAEAAAERLDIDRALAPGDRADLRGTFTVTIDPVDARDFDDAISLEHVDGRIRLGVHIADVSHYVPWDSALDREARRRATSVYLVDRVLPMLPEKLSNEICSLNPGEDRLAFSVIMDLSADAVVESYRLTPSVIRSDRRFDYESVQSYLDGGRSFPDEESERLVRGFHRITRAIGERRVARGGLDFETVEAKIILAEDNITPVEVKVRQRTDATNMIEEAMILANEVVAGHMTRAGAPMVYRIHEDPDADALSQVAVILKEFDYPIKDVNGASPATFQRIIHFAHERPEKRLINSLLLRALQRARYTDYLGSHFGLASKAYCHFTSPIRRYPDLLVHRLLRAQLAGALGKEPVASMADELEWLAEHCSTMEREAEAAENDSVQVKLAQLMGEHVGEVFEGLITGVHSFGLFVQLDNTAEGLVHVSTMTDDYYHLEPERFMLVGEERRRSYRLGERIRVRILGVSVAEGRIDLEPA
ncbi:MAG: ribonuclease R [Coriobacteriia bacterium]|nr:ribonuclease R [Coriobacteriia bacterium]